MNRKGRERCLVAGTGGHARVVLSVLFENVNKATYVAEGLIDLSDVRRDEHILGVPVIGSIDDLDTYFASGIRTLFLAIGDNNMRMKFYKIGKGIGYQLPSLVSEFAYISPSASMGAGNVVCAHAYLGPDSSIGENNLINTGSILEHESSLQSHCHMSPGSIVCGRSHIDELVMLGASATVIDSMNVAAGTHIGAGGVVVESISRPSGLYVGAPARRVSKK